MNCPKCGIEMRVDAVNKSENFVQHFTCRNPQCTSYQKRMVSTAVDEKGEQNEGTRKENPSACAVFCAER